MLPSIWLGVFLFLAVVLYGARQHRLALQTIGREAAPGIIAAQRIKAGLSDMDATAANVLLLNHGEQQEQEDDHFEARRVEVTESLETIVQGSNHSAAEIQAARTLSTALGTYENDVTVARLLHLRDQLGSRLVYRMTHSEMHDVLLPAADAFDKAARDSLEAAYRDQQWNSQISLGLSMFCGGVLLTILIVHQIFLLRRMHRVLNPALLGATVLVLGLLLYTQNLFTEQASILSSVKSSFSSVSDLWQIRALAFDADSEESRWLMDTPQAPQYESAYFTQSGLILTTAAGEPVPPASLAQGSLPSGTKCSMAGVVNAVGTSEEQAAAKKMVQTYGAFTGMDPKLRALESAGHHGSAVDFCVGRQPGQHDWAFLQFDAALGALLYQEQHTFDTAVTAGLNRFAGYDTLAILVALAVAVLSWLGLRARLREYAF
jgi:hypothetical protein